MKEILGNNLKLFFDLIDKNHNQTEITYDGNNYEVWKISEDLYKKLCDMKEEQFTELVGEGGWWRSSDGSIFLKPYEKNYVHGHNLISWSKGFFNCEESHKPKKYECLSEYLYECVNVYCPENVCAYAVDLAKANGMTMGELFSMYEG